MLFLPQIKDFKAGVAFYGFPYSRGNTNNTAPFEHIGELSTPMLIIHGSRDQASPIDNIYNYTKNLDTSNKYFELKVYQGETSLIHDCKWKPCPGYKCTRCIHADDRILQADASVDSFFLIFFQLLKHSSHKTMVTHRPGIL